MLRDGVALIVICLIVLGCVYYWFPQNATSIWAAPPARAAEAEPKVDEPKSKETNGGKNVLRAAMAAPARAAIPEPAVVEEPAPAPVVQPDPPPPPPPFPAAEKIAAGQQEETITQKYGEPAISALTSNGRHVVETFVYAKDSGRSATVIRLEDGKVSGAYAQSEPTKATGLSAPQRWKVE